MVHYKYGSKHTTHAQHLLQERTTPYAGAENDIQTRGKVSRKVNKHNITLVTKIKNNKCGFLHIADVTTTRGLGIENNRQLRYT
jgi:hypothetical protein